MGLLNWVVGSPARALNATFNGIGDTFDVAFDDRMTIKKYVKRRVEDATSVVADDDFGENMEHKEILSRYHD
jgi:hypothetical protein